jgi:hypothetical protein
MSDEPRFKAVLRGPITDHEPSFVHDLPQDNVVGVVTALAAEIWMLRDRLTALEHELATRRVLPADAVDHHRDSEDEQRANQAALTDFVNRILGELARDRTPVSQIDPGVERYLDPR